MTTKTICITAGLISCLLAPICATKMVADFPDRGLWSQGNNPYHGEAKMSSNPFLVDQDSISGLMDYVNKLWNTEIIRPDTNQIRKRTLRLNF